MRTSGRFIVDKLGAKPRAVEFDETGTTPSDAAHAYGDTLAAGRRFNTRQTLTEPQRALLEALKPAEQDGLLDKPAPDRAQILRDMAEAAARTKAAPADTAPKGDKP